MSETIRKPSKNPDNVGKGDQRRPTQIPSKKADENWDKIFDKNKKETK